MFGHDKLNRQIHQLRVQLSRAFVKDYFKDCPCCLTEEDDVLKSEAKSFQKMEIHNYQYPLIWYTTEKSYDIHKPMIDKWAKEVKEFQKK